MENPQTGQSTHNRRERPAKPALSRERVVETALGLLHTEALETVTLRRIAAALDTGPASLFVYIRNTEDLHAAMLEALLGDVAADVPDAGPWDERLIALLTGYTRVLYAHPGIARRTLFTQPHGPNYFGLVERVLALLNEGGVPPQSAAWAVDLLLQVATATAAEQATRRTDEDSASAMSSLFLNVAVADPAAYPHIAGLADDLLSGGGPERLTWAFRVLIAGVLAVRRPGAAQE